MQKQIKTWKLLLESLEQQIPAMLLYVVESKGSSPGRQGFFMAVNATGKMEGSIGGGIMEYKFVEMAKEQLRVMGYGLREPQLKLQVHDKSASSNQSGMICSGEQNILLHPVSKKDEVVIQKIIESLSQNKNGTLILSPGSLHFSPAPPSKNFEFEKYSEADWKYNEKTGYKNYLFIIGGGHCALSLSRLMSEMDFYITLFDDRENLNTIEQNSFAHEIIIVDDYTALANLVSPGPDQYVVIMTMGYRSDDVAIRAFTGRKFRYLGVLGSKKKIEKMFLEYKETEMPTEFINTIHAPVGLNIYSQTPEEIAVSIAAEIVRVKNAHQESPD